MIIIYCWTKTSWWFQPIWKILVKLDHLPSSGENNKYLKPPPRKVRVFKAVLCPTKKFIPRIWKNDLRILSNPSTNKSPR